MLRGGEEWASCRAQGLCRLCQLAWGSWGAGGARGGAAGARGGRGSARRGPRARGAWRGARRPGSAPVPQARAVAPQPRAGPWRPTVSALGRRRPRVGGCGVRGREVFLFAMPAFVPGSRGPRLGAPAPLCPSPSAAGRFGEAQPALAAPSRRDAVEGRAADAEVEGTLDAAGSGPCHRSPSGGAPGPRAGLWGTVPSRRRELLALNLRFAPSSGAGFACSPSGDEGGLTARLPHVPTRAMFPGARDLIWSPWTANQVSAWISG